MPHHCRRSTRALVALVAWGCSSGPALGGPPAANPPPPVPAPAPTPAFPDECIIRSGVSGAPGLVTVAAADSSDSALVSRERLLPPVLLDCAGAPHPGAARAWSVDSSGQAWTITLADDGPDAGAVVSAWREPPAALTLRLAGVRSLLPLDGKRLVLELERRSDTLPPVLADPALALPLDSIRPALTLSSQPSADPRDALDSGADLLRTADPQVLAYARADSGLAVVALPWSRTYVLLTPAGGGLGRGLPLDSTPFREALARDAVPGEARAPRPPFWWEGRAGCPTRAPSRYGGTADAIVYQRGDTVAGALAARLVALSEEADLTVRGLSAPRVDSVLSAGTARGIVLALPRRALVPCRETAGWPRDAAVIPLVETRASAVVRRGSSPLAIEWDGTLRAVEQTP